MGDHDTPLGAPEVVRLPRAPFALRWPEEKVVCYSALVRRETKKLGAALVRDDMDDYERRSRLDPKKYPPLLDRIFPGSFAPVVYERAGFRQAALMRYNVAPPEFVRGSRELTLYNARRDNLASPFWQHCFMRHHGAILLDGFYEWVQVAQLVSAGQVSLDAVRAEFARQAEARRQKIEGAGKRYKPTPSEMKSAHLRNVVIEFRPKGAADLVVPVIFSETLIDGRLERGFAIVTDEPPSEVVAAGHDRCPIFLTQASTATWLVPENHEPATLLAALDDRPELTFEHSLDRPA